MFDLWVNEIRPKTLLLASSNCAVGCFLGLYYGEISVYTIVLMLLIILTGVLLQIVSNLANDYGDACKGADGAARVGPIRAVMSGGLSLTQLRKGIGVAILLAVIVGAVAVGMSFFNNINALAWFLFLGAVSIVAALLYTVGMAYGYKGLGDLSVFIFFGILAVVGPQIMLSNASDLGVAVYPDTILLCISVGASSVMVLHVANMRDIDEDFLNGKKTIAVRLGRKMAGFYHAFLFIITVIFSLTACCLSHRAWECAILLVGLIPLFLSAFCAINHVKDPLLVAKELKHTLIGCFCHNVAWIIVICVDFVLYI